MFDTNKCYIKSRHWDFIYIDATDDALIVSFRNSVNGMYLAERSDAPVFITIDDDTLIKDFPKCAQWEIRVVGRALTPGQVAAFSSLAPLSAVAGAITGGVAVVALASATGMMTAGAAVVGGAAGLAGAVLSNLESVGEAIFVDW